ncbi:hypothetical protein D480_0217060 [Pseudomonas aeruginosa]|nr:hypothetical protein D480_0217060 [Pseudomonas aeruginosa]
MNALIITLPSGTPAFLGANSSDKPCKASSTTIPSLAFSNRVRRQLMTKGARRDAKSSHAGCWLREET